MKRIILLLLVVSSYLLIVNPASAATTPTDSPTPTKASASDQINQLKDRIASRVAELKLVDRRGIIGTVTDVTQTQLTINDIKGNTRFVDVDELTKFASPSAKDFGISDIKKGSRLGVLGLYNKQSRRLLSRFIDVIILPKTLYGVATSVDSDNYVVQVADEDGKITAVDIENITKTTSYDQDGNATKSGFSKIKEGERIAVIGFPDKNDSTHLIASRILLFPNLPKNPRIPTNVTPKPTTEEAPVSTGSGKKAYSSN